MKRKNKSETQPNKLYCIAQGSTYILHFTPLPRDTGFNKNNQDLSVDPSPPLSHPPPLQRQESKPFSQPTLITKTRGQNSFSITLLTSPSDMKSSLLFSFADLKNFAPDLDSRIQNCADPDPDPPKL